jgi:hypothetical protein
MMFFCVVECHRVVVLVSPLNKTLYLENKQLPPALLRGGRSSLSASHHNGLFPMRRSSHQSNAVESYGANIGEA